MKVIEYTGKWAGYDSGRSRGCAGQLELNWMYDDVLRNADRLTTYRQICAQVAREHGFLPAS